MGFPPRFIGFLYPLFPLKFILKNFQLKIYIEKTLQTAYYIGVFSPKFDLLLLRRSIFFHHWTQSERALGGFSQRNSFGKFSQRNSLFFFFLNGARRGPAQGPDPINTLRQHFWDPLGPDRARCYRMFKPILGDLNFKLFAVRIVF